MSTQTIASRLNSSRNEAQHKFSWRAYFSLTVAGLLGSLASVPAVWPYIEQTAAATRIPPQLLVAEQILQSALWLLFAVGVGLLLAGKLGLGAPILQAYLDREDVGGRVRALILPAMSLALIASAVVNALDRWVFIPRMPGFTSSIAHVSGWQGMLAAFYGAITEEILSRLFFLTLLAWLWRWLSHAQDAQPSRAAMWMAILGSAIIFGLGHLPATLTTTAFTPMVLAREVLLNGIFGTVFGYLYWKRGLESSMLAHFASDWVMHVILPLFPF